MTLRTTLPSTLMICWILAISGLLILSSPSVSHSASKNSHALFKLTVKDVEKSIAAALVGANVAEAIEARITENRTNTLYQHKKAIAAEIKTLEYDADKERWTANLFVTEPDSGAVLSAIPLGGKYTTMAYVPVFSKRIYNGDIIQAKDIKSKAIALKKIRKDIIRNPKDLIGKTATRIVSADRAIRENELQAPNLISKGDMIHMRYKTPYMSISATAEALESGTMGQKIRVKNKDSGVAVYATVSSPSEVTITTLQ